MYNFCTLFDSRYLAKGIAMIDSLAESGIDFRLYFFPFDDKAEKVIKELDYDRVIIIPLRLFEDKDLLKIKQSRSAAEYCWTCTPSTILYVLNNFQAGECTYIDADLYFYSSPERIFAEMKDSSILLTEHRYTREYDQTEISGRFCVQFTTFKKDPSGLNALIWWRNACIDWCYSRFEDGKFGDQKYLDDWPGRFPGVHVLEEPGGDLAPWNIQQYILLPDGKRITGRERTSGKEFAVIFYHFHDLKFFPGNLADLGFTGFRRGLSIFFINRISGSFLKPAGW